MKTLYLIACSKLKCSTAKPAQELYCSDLFQKSRAYVESQLQPGDSWLILSAKYGAFDPTRVIAPYNFSLAQMTSTERQNWAYWVWNQSIAQLLQKEGVGRVVFLAGVYYQKPLRRLFKAFPAPESLVVEDPLGGLEIGQRLQWLTRALKEVPDAAL